MRVAAFTKYGREAASTRQRLLQYLPALAAAGIEVDVHPLLSDDYVRALATGAKVSRRSVARSYARRLRQLLANADYDVIWIYAELFPYLPAAFERLAFWSGKPVVYDFDDAFFEPYEAKLLLRGKLEPLIGGASACCCGNEYLRSYAAMRNSNALLLPTVVNTDVYVPAPARAAAPVTIGWIGSPSTWSYVRPLLPLLRDLAERQNVRIVAVGAGFAAQADQFDGLNLIDWTEPTEVREVQRMDIGIMPLPDEPWARGKSGYKLIQYMACGLPVVASPVGANNDIVENGLSGFLAHDQADWQRSLTALIASSALRNETGSRGREHVVRCFSLATHAPRLVHVFNEIKRAA